ncbi:hypothetical protein JAMGFMIE_03172 [Rheinheimera sp. MM224]|nr:hypothetical protein JAMGFMIE_03170 [Rheinheimera sp. MM224]CAI3802726.1 hypothetical protein JAMGFMIE_03171 [Rheinheimera sp. MM224]CAI3802730.1 hypothetical protein JAMGFMIE_03172 [Rheinheimera sp. MM224]
MSLQKDLNYKAAEPKSHLDGPLFMFTRQSAAGAQP